MNAFDMFFFRNIAVTLSAIFVILTTTDATPIDIDSSISDSTSVSLASDSGSVAALTYRLNFRIRYPNDSRVYPHTGLMIAVPSRKIYWVGNAMQLLPYEGKEIERQFFVLGDKIVALAAVGNGLDFYLSSETLPETNRDDFVANILRTKVANPERIDPYRFTLNLGDVLGGPFPFGEGNMRGFPAPTITQVTVQADSFVVSLRGGKNNDIEATITFASDFRPISATLKGKQVYPKTTSPSPTH